MQATDGYEMTIREYQDRLDEYKAEVAKLHDENVQFKAQQEKHKESCVRSLNDWAAFLAGEVGEMCSLLKKLRSEDYPLEQVREEVVEEIADIIVYANLMLVELGAKPHWELIGRSVKETKN